jgi:hypothetical protein
MFIFFYFEFQQHADLDSLKSDEEEEKVIHILREIIRYFTQEQMYFLRKVLINEAADVKKDDKARISSPFESVCLFLLF